ncbi:MAG: glycosyltransferase [Eubacterium sp.]|nr:glycosyltransferase [Eubacterium sp.]
MAKKILIFKVKKFCYDSPFYFADQMAYYFAKMGWEVDVFDSDRQKMQSLDDYSGRSYDAIVDFNSILPGLDTTENEFYLDTIDGPFYNYILDHPLYHHDMIKVNLKNHNIICVDENHKKYIERWYPNIKKCITMPVAGSAPSSPILWEEKTTDLLFTGTYTDPSYILDMVHDLGKELEDDITELIKRQKEDLDKPLEDIFEEFAKEISSPASIIRFPLRMHAYFPVDTYITALVRELAVKELAQSGQKITLAGHGWEKAAFLKGLDNVTILPPVKFSEQFDLMKDSKIVLNVMPHFKAGCHDRIFSTMLSNSVSLSDESKYFDDNFTRGKDIATYSIKNLRELPNKVSSLLSDGKNLKAMAENGRKLCESAHTWEHHCRLLSEYF